MWSFSRVASSTGDQANCSRIRSVSQPSAFSSTVTGWRRLRSMRTPMVSRLSMSNSSQAPRDGMTLTAKTSLPAVLSSVLVEVDARGADQLGDDDPLGAVDDERALAGHHREVAHEDGLRLDLAGLAVHELGGDEQRRRVGHVLVPALLLVRLDLVEPRVGEGQREVAGEILDRRDLLENLVQAAGRRLGLAGAPGGAADEPVEGIGLQGEKVRYFERFAELREGDPVRGCRVCDLDMLVTAKMRPSKDKHCGD